MGVVKAMAPVGLCLLVVTFLVGMADTSRLAACCGHRSSEVQDRVVRARYLLVRIAPVAAGILLYVSMADDDLRPSGWKLRELFILGELLSIASSILAVGAVGLELSCDCVVHYWLAVAVALAAMHLVAASVVRCRLRALMLRTSQQRAGRLGCVK